MKFSQVGGAARLFHTVQFNNKKIFAVDDIYFTLQTIYQVLLDYSERLKQLFSAYCNSDDQIKVCHTSQPFLRLVYVKTTLYARVYWNIGAQFTRESALR